MTNKKGFSLIELMVVVGIFSVLAFGILTLLQNGMMSSATVERNTAVAEDVLEVRRLLGKSMICTPNFKDLVMPLASAAFQPLPALYYYDASATRGDPFLQVGVAKGGVVPSQIGLRLKKTINPHSAIADVKLTYQGEKKGWGTYDIERTIPIFVTTEANTNKIIGCSDISQDGPVLYEKICDVASGGRDYYDPVDKVCKSRFEQNCFNQGSPDVAQCPPGWKAIEEKNIANPITYQCEPKPPGAFTDTDYAANAVVRSYRSGGTRSAYPPAGVCDVDLVAGTGTCDYRAGIAVGGWVCDICCERQIVY